jgi:copper(I)-binding protein
MRRTTLAAAAVAISLLLGGCDGAAPEPAASETADATPANAPGIVLSEARVQLPVVSGRPGAAYFTLTQASGPPRKLVAVSVAMVGRAELHQTAQDGAMSTMKPVREVAIESGRTVEFKPGGYHVMLFDLDPRLRFEKSVRLTVTFDNGDEAAVAAPVTTVADSMGDMG